MTKRRAISVIALAFGWGANVQAEGVLLRLPLRVHLVTGMPMVCEAQGAGGETVRTVMDMPVHEQDMQAVIGQVNAIWSAAAVRWETDPAKGGGGIVTEQAGGGKLGAEKLRELAGLVLARSREDDGDCMKKVFPALADPARNETLTSGRATGGNAPAIYHLYVFPYVGRTLQGTARCPGTFAVIGAYSDKAPNKTGFPKRRPMLVPADPGAELRAENFPAGGALSATAAHELGHNLGLHHSDEGMPDNLMKGRVKLRLSPAQIQAARKQALAGPHLP